MQRRSKSSDTLFFKSVRGEVTLKKSNLPPVKRHNVGSLYGDIIENFVGSGFPIARVEISGKKGLTTLAGLSSFSDSHPEVKRYMKIKSRSNGNGDVDVYLITV